MDSKESFPPFFGTESSVPFFFGQNWVRTGVGANIPRVLTFGVEEII